MLVAQIRTPSLVAMLALAALPAGHAGAQVPLGSAIVGTSSEPSSAGTAGLFLVALPGGAVTPVTGLPSYLQSTGPTPTAQGIGTVAYRNSDGAIVVGTVAAAGGPALGTVELFLFYLNGCAVDPARTRRVALGTTPNTAGAWVSVLPDDRILVSAGPITAGPMATSPMAIVDVSTATPTITPLPVPPIPLTGLGGGQAVDPTGRYVYLAATAAPGTTSMVASLFRWEPATNAACLIATFNRELIQGLTCDDDGTVYVSASTLTPAAHFVHAVQPNGCNPATVSTKPNSVAVAPSGITLDRTGRLLVASAGFAPGFPNALRNTLYLVDPNTGIASYVAGSPGGWGTMGRSQAVNNAIDSYGACTDGLGHYWFANFPNPWGQPTVGNLLFKLTMRANAGTALASALALSVGRGSTQMLGADILVDLPTTTVHIVASGTSVDVPLPIPAVPALSGMVVTAQGLHLEPGNALAATRGLSITVH